MASLRTVVCFVLIAALCILNVSSSDISDKQRDGVIEELLNRVNRLESHMEYQQRVQNDLRAQLLLQKKRTSRLENIVRRLTADREENGKQINIENTVGKAQNIGTTGKAVKEPDTEGKQDGLENTVVQTVSSKPTEKRAKVWTARSTVRQADASAQVAFFATLSQHQTHIGNHQNLEFDHVVTNTGHAYNPSLGAFVAPVQGTYLISTTIRTVDTYSAVYAIAVNGHGVSFLYVNGYNSPNESTSQTAILHLMAGDDVTIRSYDYDKSVNGNHYSSFSGILIYPESSPVVVGK